MGPQRIDPITMVYAHLYITSHYDNVWTNVEKMIDQRVYEW